ncbi:MAG TPA: GGDEF domain-containing protein [Candidatus Limnocylindrales bacterium]|nr:GGDEF domain-containing protein [Candidatus Limnocylindrales bacterium]
MRADAHGLGYRRILWLTGLLAAIAAVGYLDQYGAGGLDLSLVYFMVALSAAVLLPLPIALLIAVAAAVISGALSGAAGLPLLINVCSRALIYGYATILTGRWEAERRRLSRMSRIDDLTGLYNPRALREQLPAWLGPAARTGRAMTLLMLDIDGFKAVNDHLGHSAGNELLREVAGVLRGAVRVGDAVFRFGGDEFVVLLSDTDGAGARVVAQRIQDTYHAMRQVEPASGYSVSFSIGMATFPKDGATPDSLLAHADVALYQAKRSGHGAIVEFRATETAA